MAAPATTAPAKTKSVTPTVTKDQAARQPAAESADGKRMFKRQNGEMIELPPDMTIFEAIKIEMEALAAEKKLGKGPPPKPVPVIKKEKKEPEKKKPKADQKKKGPAEKGKGKGGAAGKAALLAVGKSLVSKYLVGKASPVLLAGMAKLAKLKMNEQTHEDAAQKLGNTTKAVVHPPAEGQAKSNTGQVGDVDAKPAPKPDPQKAKDKLKQSLEENIPASIEDVDNFKKNKKGQHISADVMGVVNTDKNAVTGTFNEVTATPAPAPPEQIPEALPPEEIQPATPAMNLGAGAIAPLQKEHTDVSNFNKEADAKLQEEGVSQEQLDMVDSGDLAEANKEKKDMKKKSVTEPAQITQFAKTETQKIDTDLKKEETKEKDNLKKQRKGALGATAGKQKATKTALEKKREEVAAKINLIYTTAQTSVKKKLDNLETAAMKKFDDGNAAASKEFEDNVKREIDAFKDRRYSGFWGWAKKAKDWLLGMDDLPEVKAIFDNNRAAFVSKIDKLVADIGEENKRVVQECKDELANAKKQIKEYVDKLGPDLKDAGKKAQDEMNEKLEELDKFVAKKEEELQNKLKDKQQAAIKAIDEKIEKMKEAMSGALSKLGKLLLLAAKKFFTWALEKFGFSLADIEGIINKGAAVLKAIFTQPIKFVKNLMNAALTGFKNFGKNFLKHLQDALFEWLTGSLEGLVLPKTWNVQGILGLLLQMIGISYQNIRKHMVTVMGEPVVAGLEKSFTLVKTLITEGPMAAWEQLKEMAGEMKEAFIEAVKDFIKMKIVEQAIQWLVSLFVPGAGIIKAIVGIYDTVMFFIQKAKTIMQMVGNFLSSISDIAAGNIGAAADAMENGLARGLSLVINFLAALLRLNGITAKIKAALEKIRAKVDGVMHKVAVWIKDKAGKLIAPITQKVDQAKEWGQKKVQGIKDSITNWWGKKKSFKSSDRHSHSIYYRGSGKAAKLVVASDETALEVLVRKIEDGLNKPENAAHKGQQSGNLSKLKTVTASIKPIEKRLADNTSPNPQQDNDLLSLYVMGDDNNESLSKILEPLMPFAEMTDIPDAILPPFTNGVKANSYEAQFISKKTPHGEEAGAHSGIMLGWKELSNFVDPDAKKSIRERDNFVKMHLFHARWGKATDSNLTPAKSGYNTAFWNQVETFAVDDIDKHDKVLWYKVTIRYHGKSGPVNTIDYSRYPSYFQGQYGHMEQKGATWSKGPVLKSYQDDIIQPQFGRSTSKVFNLNTDGPDMLAAIDIGREETHKFGKLPYLFTQRVYNLRNSFKVIEGKNQRVSTPYADYADFVSRMNASAKNAKYGPISDFSEWMNYIDIAYNNGRIIPK